MSNRDLFTQFGRQLGGLLGQADLPADVERKVRALVQSGLAKMDVVTREEFDAQAAVLARTRTRVEELERKLDALSGKQAATGADDDIPAPPGGHLV